MKSKTIILFLLLVSISCANKQAGAVQSADEFGVVEKIQPTHAFSLDSTAGINSMQVAGGHLLFTKDDVAPLFEFYDTQTYRRIYGFGEKGKGNGEFVMPHLFSGKSDTVCVLDNAQRKIYKVVNGEIKVAQKIDLKVPANDTKTLAYPYVGFYGLVGDTIEWNIYNVNENKVTTSVSFSEKGAKGKVYLNTFSWDSHDGAVVFASMYFNKFRIVSLSADMSVKEDVTFVRSNNIPQEGKCYYNAVCCSKYIYLLSQKNIKDNGASGHSEVEVYDYEGKPVKKIELDGLYLYMAIDKSTERLYLYNPRKYGVAFLDGAI